MGIANAVVGTANRTHNANGTLVFGAGNEVTNSVDNIADPMSLLTNSPKELAENSERGYGEMIPAALSLLSAAEIKQTTHTAPSWSGWEIP